MWSDRTPLETVAAVQTASCPVDDDAYASFVAAVTARAKPPFSGPDPACSIPRFGARPGAVLLRREKDRLVVRGTEQPDVANATLHAFLDAVGADAAADAGLALEVSPAEHPIPVDQRRRWMVLPHAGELEPRYRAHVPIDGAPKVLDEGWATPPTPLPCMDGHEVRFRVWDPPEPDAAELIGAAIANLRSAGPELLAAATEPVYHYYLDIAGSFSADEAFEYGIPLIERPADVWKHVQLGRRPSVSASLDDAGGYLHAGVAYVTFECECDWEPEHGLALVFIDGNRLGRVSSYDGHPTWAHAYADPSMLDLVYRPRR